MFYIILSTLAIFLQVESIKPTRKNSFKLGADGLPNLPPGAQNNKSKGPTHTMNLFTLDRDSEVSQAFSSLKTNKDLSTIKFQLIDCTENKFYCEEEGLTLFPELTYTIDKKVMKYNWAYTEKDFNEFALKMLAGDYKEINTVDELKTLSSHDVSFILYYNPEISGIISESYIDYFKRIASQYKTSHVYFGMCKNGEVSYIHGVEKKDLPVLLQLGTDEAYSFNITKNLNEKRIKRFIDTHRCTMKISISDSNWPEIIECFKGKVVGISVYNEKSAGSINIGYLNYLARDLREEDDWRFQFASVNLTVFPEFKKEFGVESGNSFILADYRGEAQLRELPDANLKEREKIRELLEKAWKGEDLTEYGIKNFETSKIEETEEKIKAEESNENQSQKPIKTDL